MILLSVRKDLGEIAPVGIRKHKTPKNKEVADGDFGIIAKHKLLLLIMRIGQKDVKPSFLRIHTIFLAIIPRLKPSRPVRLERT